MDVKSVFLNGKLQECIYVIKQPLDFEDHEHPEYVYRLEKVLYGLKQAPRAWYETLTTFLYEKGFQRDKETKKKVELQTRVVLDFDKLKEELNDINEIAELIQ
ncbi:Retrovirus-related Pol polyprotein from transposon RE2-like protein [Drosera capensis]